MTASTHQPFAAEHSGVYRTPQDMHLMRQAAARIGIAVFDVGLAGVTDKSAFLAACATALEFPHPFGRNWDAFADCMQDLSWHPARGYVIRLTQSPPHGAVTRHPLRASEELVTCEIEISALGILQRIADVHATSAPLAICRAALRVRGNLPQRA